MAKEKQNSEKWCFCLFPRENKKQLFSEGSKTGNWIPFFLLHAPPRKCVLYYDPTVKCHSQEYTIFSAIAYCVLVIFIIFPTILLILYPTRLFRKCVSCCGLRRWHALHMFVESFQGEYKDGTNGTRDFRMVSESFLILRILILALFLSNHRFHHTHPKCKVSFLHVPHVCMLSQDHTG